MHQILDVERRLAEELAALLVLDDEELALDRADRCLRHVAVGRRERLGVLGNELQERAQVLEIEEQKPLLVRHPERDVEHTFLRVVEVEEPREQQWPHLRDRCPYAVTLLTEKVPEHDRKAVGHVFDADLFRALDESILRVAGRGDAGKIALDVRRKDRHAGIGKAFRQHLERDRLAGAGRAGDEAVPVGEAEVEIFGLRAFPDEDLAVLAHRVSSRPCPILS